jgi:two-component system, sensor histidine kinase and response regulator
MTEDSPHSRTKPSVDPSRWLRLRAVGCYAMFASLWILGSDSLLDLMVRDKASFTQLSTYKGWLFVAVTSALLYWLMRNVVRQQERATSVAPATSIRPWLLPFGIGAIVAITVTVTAIAISRNAQREVEVKRLQAVAELRADQVSQWLQERIVTARFGASSALGELLLDWLASPGPGAHEQLTSRLTRFYQASSAHGALVLDSQGKLIAAIGQDIDVTPELRSAVARAVAANSTTFTNPSLRNANDHRDLDIVAPLVRSGTPPAGVLVLRLDPNHFMVPTLGRWPLPSRSAASALVDRDGTPLVHSIKQGTHVPLGAALLKGQTIATRDSAGGDVLAVARPVAGTNWLVVAQVDEAEAYADANQDALWIAGCGALVVIAWAIGLYLIRERQTLQFMQAQTEQQAEKLHALQLLQSIADSSPDLIYAKDKDGRFLLFNRAAARASGVSCESAIGKFGHDIFSAAQAEQMKISDQRVIDTREPDSFESKIDTIDGPRTFISTKGLLRGPDGEPTGVFGISHDITARLCAEQAVRDSAELVQAVEDSVLDHMAVLDADGTIIAVNSAWREFGSASALSHCHGLPRLGVGLKYLDGATSDSVEKAAREGIAAVLAGRAPLFSLEYGCGCSDPNGHWFVMKVTPLKIARGGAVLVHSDISELKRNAAEIERYRDRLEELVLQRTSELERSNQTLAEGERFLRTLTDNLPASMGYWGRDLRCRFANRLCQERFDLGAETILNVDLPGLFGDRYEAVEEQFTAVLKGEPRRYTTVRPFRATERHFQVDLIPDRVDGEVQGFFMLGADVTALTDAQRQLEKVNEQMVVARDRAEAANRAKSAFLANMSHEIRTPLNAIIGFTELLRADSGERAESQRLQYISEAAQHLLQLINDILDLSKIESGKLTLEHIPFSLGGAVRRAVMLARQEAEAKGLEVAVDVQRVPDALCGDPTRLSQALLNLLGNAVKFTERGRIDLRAQVLEQSADSLLVRFEVQDTGIGIAADKLGGLFNAFEQADSSTTRRFGGTGLGLALTRHFAQLMGGEADVSSVPGQGSTFWFSARLARGAPPGDTVVPAPSQLTATTGAVANDLHAVPASDAGRARVLLVEDNRFNQEVASAVLKRAGLWVELAIDGQQAVRMAEAGRFDLVLMDLQMPVMDGFEATRQLRKLPAYAETPILALTANAFGETRSACLAAGMNDHVAKPVSPQRLCEILTQWLPHAAVPKPGPEQRVAAGLLESLAGIEGFEPAVGLALLGDQDAFIRLLQRFIANHEDGVPELDAKLAAGHLERARRMVHSLKGTSAALGARTLQHLAAACEAAIVRRESAEQLRLLAFDLQYEVVHFVGVLHDRLPSLAAAGEILQIDEMSPAQLTSALESLGFLLMAGDYGAERLHRDIGASLRKAFGEPAAAKLAHAVRNHDHERALAIVESLKAAHQPAAVIAKGIG